MPNTMMGYAGVQPQRAVMPSAPMGGGYATAMPTQNTMQSQAPNYATAMPTPQPLPFPIGINPPRGEVRPMPVAPMPPQFPIGINPPRGGVTPMPVAPLPPQFPIGINPPRFGFPTDPIGPQDRLPRFGFPTDPVGPYYPDGTLRPVGLKVDYRPGDGMLSSTSNPAQMEALRQLHLDAARQQFLAQQRGIGSLPMNPQTMQRLGNIASLAGGVRR